ncbi:MAG: GxGYxYP domain-containing protein [Anaerolineaceae bacterium]|jgi:hypothetical protein
MHVKRKNLSFPIYFFLLLLSLDKVKFQDIMPAGFGQPEGDELRMDKVVYIMDVSGLDFEDRLSATSLQGLVNRDQPRLFLLYGSYDEPSSRSTNSVQMTEEAWFSKYREFLYKNDQDNLDFYSNEYGFKPQTIDNMETALHLFKPTLQGLVVWDESVPDTLNLALMLSGLENLLVVPAKRLAHYQQLLGLNLVHDLRGKFTDKLACYRWAYQNLFSRCKAGQSAQFEPLWHRAEFTDYIVKEQLFTFCLPSFEKGFTQSLGQKLLLFLIGGPGWLRNLVFNTRLDKAVRDLGLWLLKSGSQKISLAWELQRAIKAKPYPTIFGWHTDEDDELAFMLAISANGLRLCPSFLAGNYSFHSALPQNMAFKQSYLSESEVALEEKTYLTFTLSDGDQLTLMNTAEVGNWRRPEHGQVPFNWEVQPLLAEIAPGMLGYFYRHLTPADMLVAGPSGAGYVIPPLVPNLPEYLRESARVCELADIRITTSYTADPPQRVIIEHCEAPNNFLGFIAGYFHLCKTPMTIWNDKPFVSYVWPPVDRINVTAREALAGIRQLLEEPAMQPRFIACHLFAYATTIKDVYEFVQSLDSQKIKVVRADEFLIAAKKHMQKR